MSKFHPLRVREIRRETADSVSVALDLPADLAPFFSFKQGQYLTFRTKIDGEEVRRSYSLCVSPTENELRVAIKKVEGGLFSTFANDVLRVGDCLETMPPEGRFFSEMDEKASKTYVGFAAGSGITPVISILKTVLTEEKGSRFVLFYGNRGFDSIIFREELERLKNLHPSRLAVHHVLSRESLSAPLFRGRLDSEKCRAFGRAFFQPKEVDAFFLCGPEEMVFDVKNALAEMGCDPKKVHFELFGSGKKGQKKAESVEKTTSIQSKVVVIQDGTQFQFDLPSDGSTILDAAMRAGADLPFSCKGGVCCTCRARVLDGEVEMDLNYALEPEEVEAGYILTCQAHPKTARVMVSFDA